MHKIGKYAIERLIGPSATAEVYLAKDTVLGCDVALKVLRSNLMGDEESFQRFLAQAQAATQLDHQNILLVFEIREADGVYFITMRYVEGRSLDRVLEEGDPLSW